MADSATSSSLVTTGTLDWVSLSNTTIKAPLEVLSRLAKANVDAITVGVGHIIGGQFLLPEKGQRELMSSLDQMKGFSAFSDTIWFGFGVKHVVRSLAETEQGAACVSLCASLSMSDRSPWEVGRILREMALALAAPPDLTPSIHQWQHMVKACEGSLKRSHLPDTYHHFFWLLCPERARSSRSVPLGDPETVAKALLAMGKLSRGQMLSAVFVGRADCALLATIASCLLSLSVQIKDERGTILYQDRLSGSATAIFIRDRTVRGQSQMCETLIVQKEYYVVDPGTLLPQPSLDTLGPTRWSSILSDAYGDAWKALTCPRPAAALMYLIRTAGLLGGIPGTFLFAEGQHEPRPDVRVSGSHQTRMVHQAMHAARGTCWCTRDALAGGFRLDRDIAEKLPELKDCFALCEARSPSPWSISHDVSGHQRSELQIIQDVCQEQGCSSCRTRYNDEGFPESSGDPFDIDHWTDQEVQSPWCLEINCILRLAKAIVLLAVSLNGVHVDPGTPPSIRALHVLYDRGYPDTPAIRSPQVGYLNGMEHLDMVDFLFTSKEPTKSDKSNSDSTTSPAVSALASEGRCIYHGILRDPTSCHSVSATVFIVPGGISWMGWSKSALVDDKGPGGTTDADIPTSEAVESCMVASESRDSNIITVSYRLKSRSRPQWEHTLLPGLAVNRNWPASLQAVSCRSLASKLTLLKRDGVTTPIDQACSASGCRTLMIARKINKSPNDERPAPVCRDGGVIHAMPFDSLGCHILRNMLGEVMIAEGLSPCHACILAFYLEHDQSRLLKHGSVVNVVMRAVGQKPERVNFELWAKKPSA